MAGGVPGQCGHRLGSWEKGCVPREGPRPAQVQKELPGSGRAEVALWWWGHRPAVPH